MSVPSLPIARFNTENTKNKKNDVSKGQIDDSEMQNKSNPEQARKQTLSHLVASSVDNMSD